jgi:hypothetical protein
LWSPAVRALMRYAVDQVSGIAGRCIDSKRLVSVVVRRLCAVPVSGSRSFHPNQAMRRSFVLGEDGTQLLIPGVDEEVGCDRSAGVTGRRRGSEVTDRRRVSRRL